MQADILNFHFGSPTDLCGPKGRKGLKERVVTRNRGLKN